ncbi:aminopeptidase [archaeon]|nr:aminopeptidase [archaeon]MBT7391606.1 aminopeptidase [archaeon]
MGEKNLLDVSKRYSKVLSKVIKKCLNPVNEEVVIIGDYGLKDRNFSAILSYAYHLAAQDMGLKSDVLLQSPKKKGEYAEEHIVNRLEKIDDNAIIFMNASNRMGSIKDVSYRKFIKGRMSKFCSSPSLCYIPNEHIEDFIAALDLDYEKLWEEHRYIKKKLDMASEIIIKTAAGTDLVININGVMGRSADGFYIDHGTGGNLPAGEVYIAPNANNTYGKVVIDGSSRNIDGTILTENNPITLTIEDGTIIDIDDPSEEKLLQKSIHWAESIMPNNLASRQIGEFGIGLNPKAKLIGCTLLDEKVRGTAHIAIGNNLWFGGVNDSPIHIDQVFKNPIIKIDGEVLNI